MDVAYLLQLQRSLKCHRVVPSSAEVQEVMGIGEGSCKLLYLVVLLQNLLYLVRNNKKFLYRLFIFFLSYGSLGHTQCKGKHGKDYHLTCERLC